MTIDTQIQNVAYTLTKQDFGWRDFDSYISNPESAKDYGWYYSESEQYVVIDKRTKAFYFIKARSPQEAWAVLVNKLWNLEV